MFELKSNVLIWGRFMLTTMKSAVHPDREYQQKFVPTALFLLQCGPRSPTRVQVFVRMFGYVLVRQPTVILTE